MTILAKISDHYLTSTFGGAMGVCVEETLCVHILEYTCDLNLSSVTDYSLQMLEEIVRLKSFRKSYISNGYSALLYDSN